MFALETLIGAQDRNMSEMSRPIWWSVLRTITTRRVPGDTFVRSGTTLAHTSIDREIERGTCRGTKECK